MKKQLRVGFDLDGVLLYNPARIARPIIAFIKKYIIKRDLSKFYYPKNKLESWIWNFLHKSSLWPASGIDTIHQLIKNKKIKAYIISARYESLKIDFNYWVKKIDPKKNFSGHYFNDKNEQPYLFKEKMIKKLKLDIYVEDNWDIASHLKSKIKDLPAGRQGQRSKIFWIYNILDKHIKYQYKFFSLNSVIKEIKKII